MQEPIQEKAKQNIFGIAIRGMVSLCLVFVLLGCENYHEVSEEIDKDARKITKAIKEVEPSGKRQTALTVDDRPWFGSKAVPLQHGEPLPAKFNQDNSLVITFEDSLTLDQLRIQLQRVTGVRFVIERAAEGDADGGDVRFLPSDGREVTGGRVVWQGRLGDLLNQVADTFDAEWEYKNGAIVIAQEITKTFVLHALSQQLGIDGSLEVGQDSGTSSASLPEINIERTQEANIWDEVSDTIQTIIGGRGRFALSPSTGTITVSGPPKIVRRVEAYLNDQNAMRLRRIAVAIKVLSLDVTDNFSFGADFTAAFSPSFTGRDITFNLQQPGGTDSDGNTLLNGLSTGIISGADSATTPENIVSTLTAVKDVNRVSISNSGAVVTISDHPAPLQIGTQQNFIEQVSSSSGGEGIAGVSLSPGVITTGLTFNVLPRVIEGGRILLRLDVALTELVNIQEFSAGSEDTSTLIQLPEIDTIGFLQNSILATGETLVMAGFEAATSGTTNQGTPSGILGLGNTASTNKSREVTVLLIRAEILPEDPISVLGSR